MVLRKMDQGSRMRAGGGGGGAGGQPRVSSHDFAEYVAQRLLDAARGGVRYEELARGEQARLVAETVSQRCWGAGGEEGLKGGEGAWHCGGVGVACRSHVLGTWLVAAAIRARRAASCGTCWCSSGASK